MANVPKAITDLPVASAMGDDDLLVVSQNATTSSIKGELIKGYAQNAVASQVTAAQTAATQASQSATQAEAARQGAAAAQTAAENAQDAAETARDQSVAAAGTIGDSVEQAQTAAGQASSAKDAAVSAQSAAETAKTAAETASGQAQTAATQASGSATAAQTAATQAGDAKTDAETARNEAETSASSAANSASDAESAATEAEQAKTYIENMDMEGEMLPAGSSVTVTKTTSPEGNLLFVIGVPQGIQGDKGDTGETGATGPQGVSVTNATVNEDGNLVITLSAGEPINAGSVIGPRGIQGEVGPTGASVDHIERTSGTGAPGTTDTYTVYLTDGQTGGTFQVYNGSNGTGSGDFMADGSVPMTGDLQMGGHKITNLAEPTDNTDAASKEYVDDTITVSLVGNYIPVGQKGQANGVASLDGSGKVPSAQLPPMDYVPTSRTVNGHALSADVTLDAEDVGARPDTWTPSAEDVGAIPNPSGGTAGQVLTKTADGSAWENAPSGLPDGGVEGQMLYKSADGPEWGIPPYLGSMPQLDYSQMKSLHDLGITDLNDILDPGTYVGMSNFGGYPEIANVPDFAFGPDAFFLNVYKFVDPTNSTNVVLSQTIYPIVRSNNPGTGELGGFYRQAFGNTSGDWDPWSKVMEAQHISFTPTSTVTSDNVQDAIEEVDTKLSANLGALGGSRLTVTFDESFEGLPYTIAGGEESYSGTVPESLEAVHGLLAVDTDYTLTVTDAAEDETYTCTVHTDDWYTALAVSITPFVATITVNTDAGASVTCVKGDDTQTKTATDGTAVFTVTEAGTYTVTSTSGDNVKSDTVVISADGDAKTVALYFSLSDYSPAEIAAISEAGKAAEYFQTGDTIDIQLSGIGTMTLEIADFDHDYLAGNTSAEKAGISFITKDLLYSTYQMNTTSTNIGGFPDSKLYETLSTTIWNAIPAEWRNIIKTVYKWYGTGNKTTNGKWHGCKVWIPLEYEMFGTTIHAPATEHSTGNARKYPIFTDNNSRIKKMNNGTGSARWYWEASPYASNATIFCGVGSGGGAGNGNASDANGVFFGLAV